MNEHVDPIIAQALETVTTRPQSVEERIAALRATAMECWVRSNESYARGYDAEAEISRLDGNPLRAEFYAALAAVYRDEPGAEKRKDKAYAALVASRVPEDTEIRRAG